MMTNLDALLIFISAISLTAAILSLLISWRSANRVESRIDAFERRIPEPGTNLSDDDIDLFQGWVHRVEANIRHTEDGLKKEIQELRDLTIKAS